MFRSLRWGWFFLVVAICGSVPAADRWTRSEDGRVTVRPIQVDRSLRNSDWPADWEQAFWERAHHVIRNTARSGGYGSTFFENEKRSYGWAMLSVLGGFEEQGLKYLQSEDSEAQRWNKHTLGIDYFPCFTLKHQMRKYFFFGEALEPAYRQRMKEAARIFTEQDPLRRPHYAYDGTGVWGPDGKNSWVDVRSTDNLKLMRDTSVYLLAEEAGNEATRLLYKQRIRDFVVTMYYTGMGEWDSENYLGHSIAPLLNLYDFARDAEVKRLAKAALDRMAADAAVKYWRGGFNGPTCRDYNHPYPLGGSAAALTWLWFGDSPLQPVQFESDEIHVITSAYRPPAAVVHLARKTFPRPVEIIAGKPQWTAWEHADDPTPKYRETQYFGRNFQFGTLVRGSQEPDINGFKILTYSRERGADTVIAGPVSDPLKLGSVQYQEGLIAPNSAVGQNGNMAIYLSQASDHPYLWLVPAAAIVQEQNGVTFVRCERTTLAIWPINSTVPRPDAELTERVRYEETKGRDGQVQRRDRWVHSQVLKATRQGDGPYGFAVEIDEGQPDDFIAKATLLRPETEEIPIRGAAALTAVSGRRVRLQWGNTTEAIKIWRDGRLKDFASPEENVAYRTLDGPLIDQPWQGNGTLTVTAGGTRFTSTVTREGQVTFGEEPTR